LLDLLQRCTFGLRQVDVHKEEGGDPKHRVQEKGTRLWVVQ
jgi:hypothetical protein